MFIDDFVWLSAIAEKLATKHHVNQDEVEEVSSINQSTDTLNQDIRQVRMYTPQVDKPTRADI